MQFSKNLGHYSNVTQSVPNWIKPSKRKLKAPEKISMMMIDLKTISCFQGVVGLNINRKENLEHIGRNKISFSVDGELDYIPLTDIEFLSYISMSRCTRKSTNDPALACNSSRDLENNPWYELRPLLDKVPKPVCGYANYTEQQVLIDRNNLWNETVASYVDQLLKNFTSCRSTAPPKPDRKAYMSSLKKNFK